jgi:hypothetical protein
MNKPTNIRMDNPDPTKANGKFLLSFKVTDISKTPSRKLECHGTYDKKTVDAILILLGVK